MPRLTAYGIMVGTPLYVSPEQAEELARSFLEQHRRALGDHHHHAGCHYRGLASSYFAQVRLAEAEAEATRYFQHNLAVLDASHTLTMEVFHKLIRVLMELRTCDTSPARSVDGLELTTKEGHEKSLDERDELMEQADLLRKLRLYAEAIEDYEAAWNIHRQLVAATGQEMPGDRDVPNLEDDLMAFVNSYRSCDRATEAIAILEPLCARFAATRGGIIPPR